MGAITGISGAIISIAGYLHNKIDALNLYFTYAKEEEFIEGRKLIYNLPEGIIIDEDENTNHAEYTKIFSVMNAYQQWGLLTQKRQLPFWIFHNRKTGITSSGVAIIRTYNKLKPTIEYFRKKNPKYADSYTYLYDKIVKTCPEYKDLI